jgi:CubicO group peptidase (beta-lactamase class C family)
MTDARVAAILARHIAEGGFTGAAVIGARDGETILEQYAGDAGPGLASSETVLWPIASISKMYAVAAIVRLIEDGEITLNTLACDLLPEFTGEGREEIRLRHLLTHTSGLIYESPEMEARLIAQVSLEDLVREAMCAPLKFKPGSSLAYADYNTLVAGRMAEVATGKSLPNLVWDLVLEPMKLRDTFFPTPAEQDARVATVRGVMADGTPGAMYNSRHARGLAHPAFAVTCTARDLLRFASHFAPHGPRVHSGATVRAMTQNQTGVVTGIHPSMKGYDETAPMPWGLGWALQTKWTPALLCELASFETFGHGGASGCELLIDPTQNVTLAVLTNTHLLTGREAWYRRLQSTLNVAFATLVRDDEGRIANGKINT